MITVSKDSPDVINFTVVNDSGVTVLTATLTKTGATQCSLATKAANGSPLGTLTSIPGDFAFAKELFAGLGAAI